MKKNKDLPKVEPVKIKPLFGIKPNIWVSACYLIGLLLLIFLIGFLPDIINGSKRVSFSSTTGNVAVYVDSNYIGGTPFTTKIDSGKHTATFKVEGITIDTIDFKVGHPVGFNWLFPRKMTVSSNKGISATIYTKLVKSFLEDVGNYSAILSYDNVFKYPPLFVNFVTKISTLEDLNATDYQDVLTCALAFITTQEMLNDAKQAYSLLNINYDFSEIEKAVTSKDFKVETEHLIGLSMRYEDTLETDQFNRNGVSINGYTFDNAMVTEAMYFYFVKENPEWSITNKSKLIEDNLVDEYYLDGVTLSALNTNRAVKNISYYAAKAFCKWLSEKSAREVFIPEELQWTTGSNVSDNNETMWEFTSTAYVPLLSLFDYSIYETLDKYDVQTEVIIKNSSEGNYAIGTVPLYLCSDYMGIRIAWR